LARRDDPVDSTVEDLLQQYENAESAVLRAELVAFLKSPECRTVLEQTVQKPIEAIVLSALSSTKFQEQVRNSIIETLRPEIVKAAQSAAKSALADIQVTIPEETVRKMRRDVEANLGSAVGSPRRALDVRGRDSLRNRLMLGGGVLAFIAIAAGLYYYLRPGDDRVDSVDASQVVATETVAGTETMPALLQPRQSALFAQYRTALAQAASPALPEPRAAELTCVERSIEQVEGEGSFDVAALRALLNQCPAVSTRPAAASRIIAGVQAQLTEEARAGSCGGLQPVTIDGQHGRETSRALSAYVGCTAPVGVPKSLETLGDYAAVGVYFIHKRMRDAG
jgi:hypothetical protein